MDEDLEIIRGKQAYALLENELLNEAFDAIEKRYADRWQSSTLSQSNVREEAYRMLAAVREVKIHLTSFVNTGKLASTAKKTRQESEIRGRKLNEWDGSADSKQ